MAHMLRVWTFAIQCVESGARFEQKGFIKKIQLKRGLSREAQPHTNACESNVALLQR